MSFHEIVILFLLVLLVASVLLIKHYYTLYQNEKFSKTSLATKHGLTFEQLMPFSKEFPGDPRMFRFVGDPVDGVLFGEDEVSFIEFKTGDSRLSARQNRIKRLVEAKRVSWREVRS